jgi:hypothetical protein
MKVQKMFLVKMASLLAIFLTVILIDASAQTRKHSSKMKHAAMMKDCCMMKDGKMMIMKDGKTMPMKMGSVQ